jgi:uncharacterized iron-regulated membrane protein
MPANVFTGGVKMINPREKKTLPAIRKATRHIAQNLSATNIGIWCSIAFRLFCSVGVN